ncbi:MAG: hypothetical protein ACLUT7_04945 [Ruminococcus sp.]
MIYREYTVNVSYQDAQTSYKINFKNIWPDVPELDDRYEVVSVKAPEKVNYTKADTDFFYEADMPYDGSPESKEYYDETYFYPEFKGLEVTVKDKITGKTYTKTFDGTEEDMVYISPVYVRPDDTMTNLEVDVMGDVNEWLNLPEDEEYSTEVTGTFKVNYYANGVPSKGRNFFNKRYCNKGYSNKICNRRQRCSSDRQPDDCCFGCTCNARCKRCNVRLLQKKD